MKLQEYDVEIDSMQITETYAGVLEGQFHYINQRLLEEGIFKIAKRFCGSGKTYVIFPDDMDIKRALPKYMVICQLNSHKCIEPFDEMWDCGSKCTIAFFHDDVYKIAPNELVNSMIGNLIWSNIAENWSA